MKIKDITDTRLIYSTNDVGGWEISDISVFIKPVKSNGPEFFVPVSSHNIVLKWSVEQGTNWNVLDLPMMFGWIDGGTFSFLFLKKALDFLLN